MRLHFLALAASTALIAGSPCCAQTTPQPAQAQPDDQAPPQAGGHLQTPGEAGSKTAFTAAEAPLHDLNVVRQKIPPVLLAAIADPYDVPVPLDCETLSQTVEVLTSVLGPDYDQPVPRKKKKITDSHGLALSLEHGAAEGLLPFHGYVSTLSGAAKHDELVIKAIGAGSARRAYLKGLGESRRCPAPATARHYPVPPPPVTAGLKPDYPIN